MAFGRYDETLNPVREGMKQNTERKQDAQLHQMDMATKAAKLRLDLQMIQDNEMKLEIGKIRQKGLKDSAEIEVATSAARLAQVDKLKETEINKIDQALFDSHAAMNTKQNEQLSQGVSQIFKTIDPTERQATYDALLRDVKKLPGMKDKIGDLGLTGDVAKDINKLRYIHGKTNASLAQRQQQENMQMQANIDENMAYTKGGIQLELQDDQQAHEMEIARLKIAGDLKKSAREAMMQVNTKWADPSNAESVDAVFNQMGDIMVNLGVISEEDYVTKGSDEEAKRKIKALTHHALDRIHLLAESAQLSGSYPNPEVIKKSVFKDITSRIGTDGEFYDDSNDPKLVSQRSEWIRTSYSAVNSGKANEIVTLPNNGGTITLQDWWRTAPETSRLQFLNSAWSNWESRSKYSTSRHQGASAPKTPLYMK